MCAVSWGLSAFALVFRQPPPNLPRARGLKGVGFLRACLLAALLSWAFLPPCERDARVPSTRDAGNAGVSPAMPTAREKTYPFERARGRNCVSLPACGKGWGGGSESLCKDTYHLIPIARSEFMNYPPPLGSPASRGEPSRASTRFPLLVGGTLRRGFSVALAFTNFAHAVGIIPSERAARGAVAPCCVRIAGRYRITSPAPSSACRRWALARLRPACP